MIAHASFTIKEKIQILLSEYNTLRSEILQRNSVLNQMLSVSITASIAMVTLIYSRLDCIGFIFGTSLGIFLAAFIYGAFKYIEFDTLAAAKRIREIESTINEIAGERVLVWETDRGLYIVGYEFRFRHFRSGLEKMWRHLRGRKNSN